MSETDEEFAALVAKALRLPCEFCDVAPNSLCRTTSIVGKPRTLKVPHSARLNAARYKRGSDGRLRVTGDPCKCGFVPTVRVSVEGVRWAQRFALKGVMEMHRKKHARKGSNLRPLVTLDGFNIEVAR